MARKGFEWFGKVKGSMVIAYISAFGIDLWKVDCSQPPKFQSVDGWLFGVRDDTLLDSCNERLRLDPNASEYHILECGITYPPLQFGEVLASPTDCGGMRTRNQKWDNNGEILLSSFSPSPLWKPTMSTNLMPLRISDSDTSSANRFIS